MNLCRGLPILAFTLFGGVMADRSERRWMMVATQSAAMVLALALAALVYLDAASIWVVLAVATCRGALVSFTLPARHSLISDLVPKPDLANAIALNSLTRNLTKVIGPALSRLLIGLVGIAACFAINALSFIAVLVTLILLDITTESRTPPNTSVASSLLEGFDFVRRNETIWLLVMIALVPMFFGQPYITMLTVFAHDVFAWGPEGLGLLTSCAAFGSVLGAFLLASLPDPARRGSLMLLFLIAFGVFIVTFAVNTWLVIAPVILVGAGAMQIAYNASNNTILQMTVPDHVRGRVLSTLLVNRGLVSLGTAASATLAEFFGARAAVASMAGCIVALGAVLYVKAASIRRLEV